MSDCLRFGEWAAIVRGELSAGESYGPAAHLLRCDPCRSALADARRVETGLRTGPAGGARERSDHASHEDLVALAGAVARGEFPPDAWACEECTEILLGTMVSTRLARTRPVGWLAVGSAAAAVLVVALFSAAPASQPWARAAGLRRGQAWLVPSGVAKDVERAIVSGEIAPPRFTLPEAPLEIERDFMRAEGAPRVLSPRWEMVRGTRPEFRWTGESTTAAEIFLLDGDREFLRSFETDGSGQTVYPSSAPPLTPGTTYYWKVNLLGGSEVRASAYVGFSVLGETESRECDQGLRRAGGSPFVEAVVAERCGLYSQAAAAFDRAAERAPGSGIAARLSREIRHRQGLDHDAARE